MLVIVETHPIQYHAPVWALASTMDVPIHVIYGCNFSTSGYHDKDFNSAIKWDKSLLEGYSYEFLPTNPNKKPAQNYDSVTAYGLRERVAALRPSGLLCCGYTHPLDRACFKVAKENNAFLLYRGEANDSAKHRGIAKQLARDAFLRRVYAQVHCFLSIGTEAKNHYLRLGVSESDIVDSPYAVNTRPFRSSEEDRDSLRAAARAELGIPLQRRVILYSGKLTHRKGVDQLMTAISLLPEDEKPMLLMLGDGELRESIETSLLPVDRMVLGFKQQDQLSRYFHASDMLALPSRHSETWGLVVNEALEHGLPVIVSDCVGSRHDLVLSGITGEVFKKGDIRQIVGSIQRCIRYKDTQQERQRRRDIVKRFSISAAAAGVRQAWEFLEAA